MYSGRHDLTIKNEIDAWREKKETHQANSVKGTGLCHKSCQLL